MKRDDNSRIVSYDSGALVSVVGRRREIITRVVYSDAVTQAALHIEAERIYWVRQLIRLLKGIS